MSLSRRDMLMFWRQLPEPTPEPAPPAAAVNWLDERAPAEETPPPWAQGPAEATDLVAKVLTFSCLNNMGGQCGTCIERCPEPGALALEGRVPRVDPVRCIGCRKCVDACPAPGGAIVTMPRTP